MKKGKLTENEVSIDKNFYNEVYIKLKLAPKYKEKKFKRVYFEEFQGKNI